MIEIGKKAPQFALPDQDGKQVTRDSLKGKWVVLYFYPKDNTSGCTIEGIEFTAQQAEFKKLGAVVYGISADSGKSHCAFQKKHNLHIPLLTDKEKKTMEVYGAFREKMLYGRSFLGIVRSTVLLDPQGNVAHHWQKVRAKGHAEQVLKKLQELKNKK